MDIGYRKYVTEYNDFLENLPGIIDVSLYTVMDQKIGDLIDDIASYIHDSFPSIIVSNDELVDKVKNIYIQKTNTFKKDIEFKCASIKYNLNGCFSLPKIKSYIEEGNGNLSKVFKSISWGTNLSYMDTVLNVSGDIFGTIQRCSNNNLMFAKNTKETQEYINDNVLNNYKDFMKEFGNLLNYKIIDELDRILKDISNYQEVSNHEVIDEYNN